MAYRIKGCGCDCATAPSNPCEPCNAGRFQIQCRSRAGSASLCGWDEFIASLPPRYYLDANYGGSASAERWGGTGATCGSGPEHSTYNVTGSGAKKWNPSGCTMNDTSSQHVVMHIEGGIVAGDYDYTCGTSALGLGWASENCSSLYGLWIQSTTRTQTKTQAWSSNILPPTVECGCNDLTRVDCGGGLTISLGNEDTETKAMNRSGAAWGDWHGIPDSCCTQTQAGRTGRNFTFSQAQYRIRVAGVPNSVINVEIFFTRSSGGNFSIIRQFQPSQLNFPSNPEEGWLSFEVETGSGVTTCVVGAALVQ